MKLSKSRNFYKYNNIVISYNKTSQSLGSKVWIIKIIKIQIPTYVNFLCIDIHKIQRVFLS